MTRHCASCTCDTGYLPGAPAYEEPEPENHCEIASATCTGDGLPPSRLNVCYGCGMRICLRNPHVEPSLGRAGLYELYTYDCSALVLYHVFGFVGGRGGTRTGSRYIKVRLCASCIEERSGRAWMFRCDPVTLLTRPDPTVLYPEGLAPAVLPLDAPRPLPRLRRGTSAPLPSRKESTSGRVHGRAPR